MVHVYTSYSCVKCLHARFPTPNVPLTALLRRRRARVLQIYAWYYSTRLPQTQSIKYDVFHMWAHARYKGTYALLKLQEVHVNAHARTGKMCTFKSACASSSSSSPPSSASSNGGFLIHTFASRQRESHSNTPKPQFTRFLPHILIFSHRFPSQLFAGENLVPEPPVQVQTTGQGEGNGRTEPT